jgi:serine/threonine-protein kinase
MDSCPAPDRFVALLDRRLSDHEAAALREHMDGCADCLVVVARIVKGTMPSPPKPRRLSPGDALVGRFELLQNIGEGAYGVVWRARKLSSGQLVAIKVLHRLDASHVQRFLVREARFGQKFIHEAFVPVREVLSLDADQPAIVMDLLGGVDLAAHLATRGKLPLEEALSILQQLAAALSALHAQQIAHRDLKPGNIFLERVGESAYRVRILDLGLARSFDPERRTISSSYVTEEGAKLGTPRYMAPEQLLGQAGGPPADVWALGAVAFLLLTGHRHVETQGVEAILEVLRRGFPDPAELAPEAPESVLELVRRSLQWNPAQRPTADDWVRGLASS